MYGIHSRKTGTGSNSLRLRIRCLSPVCPAWLARSVRPHARRGSALLAVLWLSAALSAIAFSLAATVRSETDRASTSVEGLKAEFLAQGAVERGLLYLEWGQNYLTPEGQPMFYQGIPRFTLQFPSGTADVEIVPETSKMSVNQAPPEDLFRLLSVLGVDPERARRIALGIVDWRTTAPPGSISPFDGQYLGRSPSFLGRHASFEEIEELLLIPGVTPELFYGTYERNGQGALQVRHGLRDCLSVYGASGQYDANFTVPEVLAAIGLTPGEIDVLVRARSVHLFKDTGELAEAAQGLPGFGRLQVGRPLTFTVRATARPRRPDGSPADVRRSAAALVKFLDRRQFREPYHILRWYGNVWTE